MYPKPNPLILDYHYNVLSHYNVLDCCKNYTTITRSELGSNFNKFIKIEH